jgi:hypothetical protein
MSIQTIIEKMKNADCDFNELMQVIDTHYEFSPTAFKNGNTFNQADTNNGSCKLFAFAKLNQLDEQTTLNGFGDFYKIDVLQNPNGEDHQNIRNFMQSGWEGIEFEGQALKVK